MTLRQSSFHKRFFLKTAAAPLLLALGLCCGVAQAAENMVVVGYGGAGQKAQEAAFFQPFSKQSGVGVTQTEYNGEMARIKVMADTGHADWDVVQIEDLTLRVAATRACSCRWTGSRSAARTS